MSPAGKIYQQRELLALLPTGVAVDRLSSAPSMWDKIEARRTYVTFQRPPSYSRIWRLDLRFILMGCLMLSTKLILLG